jgi:transposase-like protein
LPIGELLDDSLCPIWLERHLHADRCNGPRCGRTERRLCREQGYFPAYRCRACAGDYTLLTGTVFETTRPRPAILVRLRRGIATGEPTARLARELGRSRKPLHTLRQRIQAHRNDTMPTDVMTGTACEADERYQHAGKNSTPHRDPNDPPRRRAHQRQGHGT